MSDQPPHKPKGQRNWTLVVLLLIVGAAHLLLLGAALWYFSRPGP